MACKHKFYDWLYLLPEKVDWEIKILIVGTFNPGWYSENNYSEWFYGRTQNNLLWQILPELKGYKSLINSTIKEWIEFCKLNKIGFTDLIEEIITADEINENHKQVLLKNFSDTALINTFRNNDIKWTNLESILNSRKSITEIYLTNSGNNIWGKKFNEAFKFHERNDKDIYTKTLYTPSKEARFWMKKNGFNDISEFIKYKWLEKGFKI